MTSPTQYIGRKAVKATVRHGVRGTTTKARREPPRAISLIGLGIVLGAVATWILSRRASGDPFPAYEAPPPSATHSTPEAKAAAAT